MFKRVLMAEDSSRLSSHAGTHVPLDNVLGLLWVPIVISLCHQHSDAQKEWHVELSAGGEGNLELKMKPRRTKRPTCNQDPSRSRPSRYEEEIFKRCVRVMDRCNNSLPELQLLLLLLRDKLTDHRTLFITALPLTPSLSPPVMISGTGRHFTQTLNLHLN